MSQHAYAHLCYGYDLGGEDGSYKIVNDLESLSWYEEEDFVGAAEDALLAAVGFTEKWNDPGSPSGYYSRRKEALKKVGPIGFFSYGDSCSGYTGTILFAGPYLNVNWIEEIEIPEITDEHRARLEWALDVLGITPARDHPQWLLSTHYG